VLPVGLAEPSLHVALLARNDAVVDDRQERREQLGATRPSAATAADAQRRARDRYMGLRVKR
jgi:hypothetical protein